MYQDISKQTLDTLRLIRSDNIGPKTFCDLIKIFGTPTKALEHIQNKKNTTSKIKLAAEAEIQEEIEKIHNNNAFILSCFDRDFPELLKETPGYPPIITIKGRIDLLKQDKIAIVGSRNASTNGMNFAYQIAQELSQYVICSGLARGIDTYAHMGSIKNGTIAVIAGGIDNIYPPENKKLYEEITTEGLLITESAFGTVPKPQNFPSRNRIISGLSLATIIVEANIKSGSLITAKFALEQNREIFAVPGFPLDQRYSGTNKLIKEGAHLFESVADVKNVLEGFQTQHPKHNPQIELFEYDTFTESDCLDSNTIRNEVLKSLTTTPTSFDNLARILHFPRKLLHLTIVELELEGNIKRIGLNHFITIL
ncbi:MAG: DNA-processing protein DprA [Rickettsiales bacterium]|nr:DNA-processing protein DprA [Rickettsiales bacterium]